MAATYYVDPRGGSDCGNDGRTEATAFKTLKKAIAIANAAACPATFVVDCRDKELPAAH